MGRIIYQPFIFILTFHIAIPLEAITVPICPTNKIAPHRRHIPNLDYTKPRTFAAYYDLLVPSRPQYQNDANDEGGPVNDLQEKPQEDDPDDCGEIEDYDENDLSSLTPEGTRRQGQNNKFFFGWFRPPHHPPLSTVRPQDIQKPSTRIPSTRPPYHSGYFSGNHFYRPPSHQIPSDNIKPIHENPDELQTQSSYNPNLVGVPSGQIVGASPARPTTTEIQPTTPPFYPNRTPRNYRERNTYRPYYPSRVPPSPRPIMYPVRGQRPRNVNNNGILGSFIDLLFK